MLDIRKHVVLKSSVFGSNYRSEQLLSLMNIKSRIRMHLIDEHLDRFMGIATTETKTDTERLLQQKMSNISLLTKFILENY